MKKRHTFLQSIHLNSSRPRNTHFFGTFVLRCAVAFSRRPRSLSVTKLNQHFTHTACRAGSRTLLCLHCVCVFVSDWLIQHLSPFTSLVEFDYSVCQLSQPFPLPHCGPVCLTFVDCSTVRPCVFVHGSVCVGVCLLTAFSLGPQCWVCWTASGWTETESAGKDRTSMCESAAHTGKHHQLSFLPSDINRTGNWETRALTSPLTCSDDEPLCFSGLMVWTFSLYKLIHLFVNQTCSKSADASSNNPVS